MMRLVEGLETKPQLHQQHHWFPKNYKSEVVGYDHRYAGVHLHRADNWLAVFDSALAKLHFEETYPILWRVAHSFSWRSPSIFYMLGIATI